MIKDITIGQYYSANSVVHRMDARMKIVLTFALIISIFLCKSIPSLALIVLITVALILVSRVPLKMVLKSVKPIAVIVIFTGLLNLFYVRGGTPLLDWHFIHITSKGIFTAVFMAIRIICLVIISSLLTYTTTPTMLTDAIERLLSPLKIFKVPVHTLAMMMTLALRFIPTLVDEIDRITNAQKARGADLESGGIVEKIKALIPIIVPLFVSAIRRAYELADAMDCRCYVGGEGRTRMKKMKLGARDFISLAITAAVIIGIVLLNVYFPKVI
ncbi:MAG: energy-coupling factor transporter transmembrane component T [Oscillospiraceae bacterium]|nr:energy-coupling factor transporter transmembrane protein EcfT [Ruminococcus sp.]MDD7338631.1 energy-coupling factor transporter transmembrane component T [Ruminococcus sp.]MDY6060438.1 energy-coupling factor transporter transmembrane component T [Oscillospiraceae bacterium]